MLWQHSKTSKHKLFGVECPFQASANHDNEKECLLFPRSRLLSCFSQSHGPVITRKCDAPKPGCHFSCYTRPLVRSWPAWGGWGWGWGRRAGRPTGPPTPPAPACSWRSNACGCGWWSPPPAGSARSSLSARSFSPCRPRTGGTHCEKVRSEREREREIDRERKRWRERERREKDKERE